MEKTCFLCKHFSYCRIRTEEGRRLFTQRDNLSSEVIFSVLPRECGKYREDRLMKSRKKDAELLKHIASGAITEIKVAKRPSELVKMLVSAAKEHKIVAILRINNSYLIQGTYRDMEQARISTAGMHITLIDPAKMFRF